MKGWGIVNVVIGLIVAIGCLGGCGSSGSHSNKAVVSIDWVDFVKLDGHSYSGTFQSVIGDPGAVTDDVVGKVKFNVADAVHDPGHKTKDGDAAFLAIGTKLYRVEGYGTDRLLAAEDETRIGGYRLYRGEDADDVLHDGYSDVPKDKIERIELYRGQETKPYKTLQDGEKDAFMQVLESGQEEQGYSPQTGDHDPAYYEVVFYVGGPLAFVCTMSDDDVHVAFYPSEARIVDDRIRQWIHRE